MELYIRSQDKYTLSKYNDRITIIDGTGLKEALNKSLLSALADMEQMKTLKDGWCVNVDDITLGTYATKERALEVLNEIQQAIITNDKYDYTQPPVVSSLTCNLVYEMPKE